MELNGWWNSPYHKVKRLAPAIGLKSGYFSYVKNPAAIWVLSCFLLATCSSPAEPEQELHPEQFTGDRVGLQGAEMGDNIRTIMARESNNIVHQMPDELTARIPINQKDSTYYEITYNFNDGGLYVIDMEIYPRDSSDGRIIFDQFATYYNRRFGNSAQKGHLFQWSTYSSRQTIVEISMSDQALLGSRPSLSITFFEKQE